MLRRLMPGRVVTSRPRRWRRLARDFRGLAIEMGGVLIKLGQFLSTRVDVLPPEITEELLGLQDEVPPVPPAEMDHVLHAELADKIDAFLPRLNGPRWRRPPWGRRIAPG